jgi:glucosamine-6-phosphate deaminase
MESKVEQYFLLKSGRKLCYAPTEKTAVIEVENFPMLGKFTALRFLEWVQHNPGGVVSLPTGKTPEHFIKWVTHYLKQWKNAETKKELEIYGIDSGIRPSVESLVFVQIDEFYPIDPIQNNSFHYYIMKYYIKGFSLDIDKALLINAWNVGIPKGKTSLDVYPDGVVDLTLRTRYGKTRQETLQKQVIESVDQYCTEYESRIRELGGIGFFLGGIGPDGHIGFNVKGSDHYCTTRLTRTNYETQAAAAIDLGGIEIARNRLVITIGLSTITFNPETVAIINAAGEAKARVLREAIEEPPSNLYPATALQRLKNARFYLTKGAASRLVERCHEDLTKLKEIPERTMEHIIVDVSMATGKKLQELGPDDFNTNPSARYIAQKLDGEPTASCQKVEQKLISRIQSGLESIENHIFFHTSPHHDDDMLGYWAYIVHLVRSPKNKHFFQYMTSGFNAVTNAYAAAQLENLQKHINTPAFTELLEQGYFDPNNTIGRNWDMYHFLDGVAAHSRTLRQEGEAKRMLRNLIFIFEETSSSQINNRISELLMYFKTQYPGKKDLPFIQQIKGMIREWEADLVWGYLGFDCTNVVHLR